MEAKIPRVFGRRWALLACLVLGSLALVGGAVWWTGDDGPGMDRGRESPPAAIAGAEQTPHATARPDDLVLVESRLVPDSSGWTLIEGAIRNTGTRPYAAIEARFELFGANGTSIGTASVYRNDLMPNETWEFEAVAIEGVVADHRLIEIVAA